MASLEAGFSHDIFVEWAPDVKNLVLFTERGQVRFFSSLLLSNLCTKFASWQYEQFALVAVLG